VFDSKDAFKDLGRLVYGASGIALGVLGLVSQDFAAVWQPIDNLVGTSHRALFAILFAACLLAAGVATAWRSTARIGFLALAILHALSALGWVPRVLDDPSIFGTWNGLFEQLALVAAGIVGYASWSAFPWSGRAAQIGCWLFGICALSFGAAHLIYIPETAGFIPKWIPPGPEFWAYATGAFHLLAGVAILSGVIAVLASRLLTAMMIGFGLFVWAPNLYAQPGDHFTWAGNCINLALVGAAWVIADSIGRRTVRRERELRPQQEQPTSG
jgi:uncharacterized membrane protein YphA (DoxX/SURF4 family)